ncbi:PDR/VanB family oxidoreductase [Sodalis praecaptivus]|uniref:PDR/VanB family oxidoreductase n=1 Tax=Sodalis praecaptivus TaxID=1239307 RepID=UPI00280A8112|nr:PDR/VanB family oxidoreductase [Sodalis praecaptivus]
MMNEQPFMEVVVTEKRDEGTGVIVLTLERPDGQPLPAWRAGAHIAVRLSASLLRHYSLCGDPAQRHHYRLAVLVTRHSRGAGEYLRQQVMPGQILAIGAPVTLFALQPQPYPALLLAGGIGITPLLPMALTLARQGRPYRLHYFGRPDTLSAFDLQETWREIAPALSVHHQAPADPRGLLARWLRHVGRSAIYLCGSQPFTAQVRDVCARHGVADEDLHYELFSPPALAQAGTFIVQLHPSGQRVAVTGEQTIVEALSLAGIETACGIGVCGTCQARVVRGTPDHRDTYLTPA